jgi:hypothetical protein
LGTSDSAWAFVTNFQSFDGETTKSVENRLVWENIDFLVVPVIPMTTPEEAEILNDMDSLIPAV